MKDRPSDGRYDDGLPPLDPADEELTADERAQVAGTGDAAVTGDTHVAGPSPSGHLGSTPPPPATIPDLPREEVATSFPEPGGAGPGQAGEPIGTGTGLGTGPGQHEATPGPAPAGDRLEHLFEPGESNRYQERWREVQSGFVDDPHDAVQRADELAAEVVNALGQALTSHKRTLDERWRTEKEERPDTEALRLALRGYREFLDRMLAS